MDYGKQDYTRGIIGLLTMTLPTALWLGGMIFFEVPWMKTVSSYYYHHPGLVSVFIGILCFNGLSLILYPGSGKDQKGKRRTTIAGYLAVIVAVFPQGDRCMPPWIGNLHYVAAATLLVILAYISAFDFARSPERPIWRILHRLLAAIVLLCILLIGAGHFLGMPQIVPYQVFMLESIALVAVGASWYKARTIRELTTKTLEQFTKKRG